MTTLDALLLRKNAQQKPITVCLCGSTRFSQAWQDANLMETLNNKIVLSIGCNTKSDEQLAREDGLEIDKEQLDILHLWKIEEADEVLILNVGNYIGESTQRELEYAIRLGKTIRFLEPRERISQVPVRREKWSGNCGTCGIYRESLHRDHIIPRWKYGTDDDSNIQWLCANCHEDKTKRDLRGIPGPNRGRKFSLESRQRMGQAASRSQKRKGHTKGRKLSAEHRRKISESNKGKHHVMPPASEERKRKVSESLKQYHAKRREQSENEHSA